MLDLYVRIRGDLGSALDLKKKKSTLNTLGHNIAWD